MRRVVILPEATEDPDQIFVHTARTWGMDQAERYLSALEDSFTEFSRRPSSGRPCDSIRPGLRREPIKSHVIYLLVSGKELTIVRVLHKKMLPELHTL